MYLQSDEFIQGQNKQNINQGTFKLKRWKQLVGRLHLSQKKKASSVGLRCFLIVFLDLWKVRTRAIFKMLSEMLGQELSTAIMPSKKTEDDPR